MVPFKFKCQLYINVLCLLLFAYILWNYKECTSSKSYIWKVQIIHKRPRGLDALLGHLLDKKEYWYGKNLPP